MSNLSKLKQSGENKSMVLFVAIVGAFAGLIFGVDIGVISGALPLIAKGFYLTNYSQEMVVSSSLLGAVIGALASNPLSRWLGLTQKYTKRSRCERAIGECGNLLPETNIGTVEIWIYKIYNEANLSEKAQFMYNK